MPPRNLSARLFLALAATLQLAVVACATPVRVPAVPSAMTARADPGIPDARFFPDRAPGPFVAAAQASYRRELDWRRRMGETGPLPPADFLTISGGGGDGAFGAGLLTGWSQAGTRPEFKLVTGISTGALIAPFAFLGSSYDPILKETYTQVSDQDIFRPRNLTAALWNDAMADTVPMAQMVDRYVTPELLAAVAAEYAKGRLLIIGTTNLDSREPVYWNMGAIASSPDPRALTLFRKVILASAAIPGAFPPVMIDVTVDGVAYQEMHVDGGATRQVFMYPPTLNLRDLASDVHAERIRRLYIIRNARLDPEWASVDRRTLSIANRAVSSLIQTQGIGDLSQIYLTARRDRIDYNLAYIPAAFDTPKTAEFDPVYMTALFELGRSWAVAGYPWDHYPPGFTPQPRSPAERNGEP